MEHLTSVLDGGRSLAEWCAFFEASGRNETIKELKAVGVEKLGDRQKVATLVAKATKASAKPEA